MNPRLFNEEEKEDFKGLAVQHVYKIKVYFTVKLPEDYVFRFGEEKSKKYSKFRESKTTEGKLEYFLDFCEEVIGVGSPSQTSPSLLERRVISKSQEIS